MIEKVSLFEGKVKELEERCSSQADLFVVAEEEKIRLSKELEKLQREQSNAETSAITKYSSPHEYFMIWASSMCEDLNTSELKLS